MKDRQALVESGISTPGDFTFFDTLDDPAMKKISFIKWKYCFAKR